MVWGSWYVTTGNYLLQTLQFSGREVGLVYGAMSVAAFISPIFAGYITDRYFSASRVLGVLHILGSFCLLGMHGALSFRIFYPLTLLYAILYLPTFALSSSYVLQQLQDPGKQFPGIRMWGTLGWIIAGNIVGFLGWEKTANPLLLAASLSFFLGLYSLWLPGISPLDSTGKAGLKAFFTADIRRLFGQRNFLVFMVALTLLYAIPIAYYYGFVNTFLTSAGIKHAAAWMSLGQVTEMAAMLALPYFLGRFSFRWIVFTGLFLWGIRYVGFAMLASVPSFKLIWLPAILVHGFAYVFTGLAGQLYIDGKAPKHLRSTAQAIITFAMQGPGTLLGTYFAGWMVDRHHLSSGQYNWSAIWLTPALAGLALSLLFLLFFKQGEEQEQG